MGNDRYIWNEEDNWRVKTGEKWQRDGISNASNASVSHKPTFTTPCLNARSSINKLLDLEHLLLSTDPDVVTITETWLSKHWWSRNRAPNYAIIRKDRPSRAGGIAMAPRQNILFSHMTGQLGVESLWLKLLLSSLCTITVGIVHWPLKSDTSVISSINEYLCRFITPRAKLILTGDFNIPTIDWTTMSAASGAGQTTKLWLDLSFSHNLQQVVLKNTRVHNTSASILDRVVFLTERVFSK